jgi:Family of unknown function (DUF6370)
MKALLTLLLLSFATASAASAQAPTAAASPATPDKTKELLLVDASCGQCRLGLKGKDCDLAIRLNGKAYFVDGTTIDSHGDAHANNGFCNTVRKAEVQGEIVNNRFKASYFKLLPEVEKAN